MIEYLSDIGGIHADEKQVRERILFHFLQGAQQDAGVALDSQIIDVGMRCGKIHHEAALSHTDLNVKRLL